MPALNRKDKIRCQDSGKEYMRASADRHSKSCLRGVISCIDCNDCTYNQQEINFHTSERHVKSTHKSAKSVPWKKDFLQAIIHLNKKDHGLKMSKTSGSIADVNRIPENEEDIEQLQDDLVKSMTNILHFCFLQLFCQNNQI